MAPAGMPPFTLERRQAGDPSMATPDMDINRMSVRQLKAELNARDVDISFCRHRSELLVLLRKARTAGPWDNGSFARRESDNSYCWVELVEDGQAFCHWSEGSKSFAPLNELTPIQASEMPSPPRFEGTFEAARAEAHSKGKLLVVAVVTGRGKPHKDEAMHYMALASEEVKSMMSENAIFWRGKPTELRETQLRQLVPIDMLPALATAIPLASDAMSVIMSVPGLLSRAQALDTMLEGMEALDQHRQVVQNRQNNEDVRLRQAQDAEYAEGLAHDQAADAARVAGAPGAGGSQQVHASGVMAPVEEAPAPAAPAQAPAPAAPAAPAAEEAAADSQGQGESAAGGEREFVGEVRARLAEEFLAEGANPSKPDPVRLVLKLPTGERVERTFSEQDQLLRVRRWAEACPLLPEAENRPLRIPLQFELATAFPRRLFTRQEWHCSLRDLGLAPSAALLLVEEES
eukprot:TRINITY_DN14324_c1_g1_i1.p1 TRINITY_DN14324_c1_g1~~TRINITY_DN14324_c1_g1_i1.p1  ORF type:complete len:484 (-),score=126.98 TRINITY_DN14324_c1_g1_i1:87-1469(-)